MHRSSTTLGLGLASRSKDLRQLLNLYIILRLRVLLVWWCDLTEVGGEFESADPALVITHKKNRLKWVEDNMGKLGLLHGLLVTKWLVLVLVQVKDVDLTVGGDSNKDSGGERCPCDITDRVVEVEGHHRMLLTVIPNLYCPISRGRNKHMLDERVPPHAVDRHMVIIVCLEVLAVVCLRTLVDLTLLGSQDEKMMRERVEIETGTPGKASERGILIVTLLLTRGLLCLENHDIGRLELVFDHGPVGDAAVGGDGIKVEVLTNILVLPDDLPDRVCVFTLLDSGEIHRSVHFHTHIKDHHSTIIATDSNEGRMLRVEVEAHDTGISGETILWV